MPAQPDPESGTFGQAWLSLLRLKTINRPYVKSLLSPVNSRIDIRAEANNDAAMENMPGQSKETLIAEEQIFRSMEERHISQDFDRLDRLRKRIGAKLEEARERSGSDKTIRDLQKRAVMQLQQFYKLLLSDYSPTDVKQMKLFLKHNGFPDLREALRMKPAKISEKLKPVLTRLDCEPARKRQLQTGLQRIEETVSVLDREIFNYSSFSKKEQRMLERLEEIDGKIENILYLAKKNADLQNELKTYMLRIPAPEGTLDIEALASSRYEEKRKEAVGLLASAEAELRSASAEETDAMEKLKNFLHSSGTLLDPVVRIMPRIKEMTSSVVKSAGRDVTEWDVGIALSRIDKFISSLPDNDQLRTLEPERIRDALNYIHINAEALTDYNRVLRTREKKQSLEEDMIKLRESFSSFENGSSMAKEMETARQEAAKNLEAFRQIRQEQEKSVEEIEAELRKLSSKEGGTEYADIDDEVDKILSKL